MKNILKLSALAVALVATATYASASPFPPDTIQLGSYATGWSNMGNANTAMNFAGFDSMSNMPTSGVGNSFYENPSNVWSAALPNSTWVGSTSTSGPVGTVNPDFGFYTYTTNFSALMPYYSGTLSVLADDTTAVYLNGNLLIPAGALGSDTHCADKAPTCGVVDTVSLHGVALNNGEMWNTLTFVVQQAGTGPVGGVGDPSGVDFSASLTSVPEPSTLMMLGTGLLGSAGALFRRMRS